MENISYKTLLTFSRNYGIQDDWVQNAGGEIPEDRSDVTPIEQFRRDQYSWLMSIMYNIKNVNGMTINLKVSGDFGELYKDRLGIKLGASWSDVF